MDRNWFGHYTLVPDWRWTWKNFTPKEIACKGDGSILVNDRALDMLQALREKLGCPLIVNSGYRSPHYNKQVGGATRSKHKEGIAFDISLRTVDRKELTEAAIELGFKGIGQYNTFVHIDARDTPGRWDYRT